MKIIIQFFGFLFVKAFDVLMAVFPRRMAIKMGECVGILFSWVLSSRRKLVLKNIQLAFPELSLPQVESMAKASWENVGRVAAEFIRIRDINDQNFSQFFDVEGLDHLENAIAADKGVVFIGFHFANWEYSGLSIKKMAPNLVAIARPIKNPFVEKWVQGKRRMGSMDIILHRNAVKGCLKALKAKRCVGILVDQNLYTGGVFVNFFGRPAASTTLPALLHLRTGAPVMLAYCLRDGERFKLIFEKPIEFLEHNTPEEALQKNTQIISDHVEQAIRQQPESWFWVHNRWKRAHEFMGPQKT